MRYEYSESTVVSKHRNITQNCMRHSSRTLMNCFFSLLQIANLTIWRWYNRIPGSKKASLSTVVTHQYDHPPIWSEYDRAARNFTIYLRCNMIANMITRLYDRALLWKVGNQYDRNMIEKHAFLQNMHMTWRGSRWQRKVGFASVYTSFIVKKQRYGHISIF